MPARLADITAVVVTHQSSACVEPCLHSIKQHLPAADVILVDNASTDDTVRRARTATDARTRVIGGTTNVGYGAACNLGARAARSGYVLFLNPDVVIEHFDAGAMTDSLLWLPFGVGAPCLATEDDSGPAAAQCFPFSRPSSRRRGHTWGMIRPRELPSAVRPVDPAGGPCWASGAALLVRREEFIQLGGFDERYFLYYEDQDISRRYLSAEWPVRRLEGFVYRHSAGTSTASAGISGARELMSFLGWLQYEAVSHGRDEASAQAIVAMRELRLLARLAALPSRLSRS